MRALLILSFIACISGSQAHAQQSKIDAIKLADTKYTWQQYDSLGDEALYKYDTAQAILYYQKSVELNPQDKKENRTYRKLKKHYTSYTQSFYLKEY